MDHLVAGEDGFNDRFFMPDVGDKHFIAGWGPFFPYDIVDHFSETVDSHFAFGGDRDNMWSGHGCYRLIGQVDFIPYDDGFVMWNLLQEPKILFIETFSGIEDKENKVGLLHRLFRTPNALLFDDLIADSDPRSVHKLEIETIEAHMVFEDISCCPGNMRDDGAVFIEEGVH